VRGIVAEIIDPGRLPTAGELPIRKLRDNHVRGLEHIA
jgi:hypothetical protein